jgi:hypothetical protein
MSRCIRGTRPIAGRNLSLDPRVRVPHMAHQTMRYDLTYDLTYDPTYDLSPPIRRSLK